HRGAQRQQRPARFHQIFHRPTAFRAHRGVLARLARHLRQNRWRRSFPCIVPGQPFEFIQEVPAFAVLHLQFVSHPGSFLFSPAHFPVGPPFPTSAVSTVAAHSPQSSVSPGTASPSRCCH